MAEPWLSIIEKVTEFFSPDQSEASARRTKFVQRDSKMTGQLFLALVTLGHWSTARPTVARAPSLRKARSSAGGKMRTSLPAMRCLRLIGPWKSTSVLYWAWKEV